MGIWKITAYNGTQDTIYCEYIYEAIDLFLLRHKLHMVDIKEVINLH